MDEILSTIDFISRLSFMGLLFVMLYLSIKKCFLKNSKIRLTHIFMILFTNPFVIFVLDALLIMIIYDVALKLKGYDLTNMSNSSSVIFSLITGIIFVLLVLLLSLLVGKKLKANNMSLVTYIYLMFSILLALSSSKLSFESDFVALQYSVSVLNNIALIVAILLIYTLVVKELAKMPDNMSINWKIFVIPPLIFLLLYYMADFCLYEFAGGEAQMTAQIFSIVVLFLFVWAFYIITKNINATNEAITAKNDIQTLSVEVMEALAHTIDAKDKYTRGHSIRVAKYSRMIAGKMGLSQEQCENIYYMGLLHDIGKIGVPNEIINKPGKLTDTEFEEIKKHPVTGFDILAEIKSRPNLSIGARWHHERIDGKGYPDQKSCDEIPIEARIIAVADSYDAMTSNRSYRQYLPQDVVRSEIEKNIGSQFDEVVAKCMLQIIDEDTEYVLHE